MIYAEILACGILSGALVWTVGWSIVLYQEWKERQ
jgi:hypothetical protein